VVLGGHPASHAVRVEGQEGRDDSNLGALAVPTEKVFGTAGEVGTAFVVHLPFERKCVMNAAMMRAAYDNPRAGDRSRSRTSWRTKHCVHGRAGGQHQSWSRAGERVYGVFQPGTRLYAVSLTYSRIGAQTGSAERSRSGMWRWSKSRSRKDVE
jgi:hypothetical protein